MKCPECSFDNREGAKFCLECGKELETKCPQCGKTLPLAAKFCDGCGHDLRKPKEVPAIDYRQPRSYTPKHLADKILSNRIAIEGERKLVSILFADVANSTAIFENLDPEQVHEIMDGCFRILMDEIHRYDGTINQFTGDGVMALFGAPISHEDHAQRACYASLAIQKALIPYAESLKKKYDVGFKMRIGLNSGPVVVGSIGDDLRMDYTAQGDTANLAARMESNAEPGTVLVSEQTYRLAEDFFVFEELGPIPVKGKAEPVEVYRPLKSSKVETRIDAAAKKGLTRFVGREWEVAALREAFEKAGSGSGQVVGIVGEAGVGKSRLLLEFRSALPKGGYTYLEGRCFHYGGAMPYLPMLDVLRAYLGIKEGEQELAIKQKMAEKILGLDENLREVLAAFQELLSVTVDDEAYVRLEPKQKRDRIFESMRDLLIRASEDTPLILAIEDLHWMDKTTEEFLDYFIGWLSGARILLLLLYRPEYTHQWGSKSYYAKVGVGPLSTISSTELVEAVLSDGEVVPELQDLILSRTTGNPLFMEELTHTLLENGSIQQKGQQYTLVGNSADIQVPDTVQGVIAARIDRLEDSLKRLLHVASVIGREFFFRILQTITGMKEELKSYLLNLQGLEFIYEKKLFPELEYIFKHALTQEVAYHTLLMSRRKEIHEKIGRAIEEIYPERLEEFYEMLAYHYSKAENAEKAYNYLKLSGQKAEKNHSLWEAFRFYKEAMQMLRQMPETEENRINGIEMAWLYMKPASVLGFPDDPMEILQEGERLAKEVGDDKALTTFYSFIGLFYSLKAGDLAQGVQRSEAAFKEAEKKGDLDLISAIGYDLCVSWHFVGAHKKMINVAGKVLGLLEASGREAESFGRSTNVYSSLYSYHGFSKGIRGDFEEERHAFQRGFAFAGELEDFQALSLLELNHGMFLNIMGDGPGALEHLENCLTFCEQGQVIIYGGLPSCGLGWAHCLVGELQTALRFAQKALGMHMALGIPYLLSLHHQVLGIVHLDLGNLTEARVSAEEALKSAQQGQEKWMEGMSWLLLGRVIGKADPSQSIAAEQSLERGMDILADLEIRPYCAQAHFYFGELFADTGREAQAAENLKRAESMFQEMGMDYWLGKTQEVLARL